MGRFQSQAPIITVAAPLQHNVTAVAAPAVTDDSSGGYAIGSLWTFFSDPAFDSATWMCTAATVGAAVWVIISSGSGVVIAAAPLVTHDESIGVGVGTLWADTTTLILYMCADATVGAAIWVPVSAKNEYAKIVPPTATDDASIGYTVGSIWIASLPSITSTATWMCSDSTASAAVWVLVSPSTGVYTNSSPTTGNNLSNGFNIGSQWINSTTGRKYLCVISSLSAATWELDQPAFRATAGVATNWSVVGAVNQFNTVAAPRTFDEIGGYNPATGIFTVPSGTSRMSFTATVGCIEASGTGTRTAAIQNVTAGTTIAGQIITAQAIGGVDTLSMSSGIVSVAAGDQIQVFVIASNGTHVGITDTNLLDAVAFSGLKIE